jgi:hypothetical protein
VMDVTTIALILIGGVVLLAGLSMWNGLTR